MPWVLLCLSFSCRFITCDVLHFLALGPIASVALALLAFRAFPELPVVGSLCLPPCVMTSAFPGPLDVSDVISIASTVVDEATTVLDSTDIEVDDASSDVEVVMECAALSEGSASEASGPWAAGWVPACPPGLMQCPHCMTFVPPSRWCDYCLGQLADGSSEEDSEVEVGAGSVASSGASTVLPRSNETELDSSGSDCDLP